MVYQPLYREPDTFVDETLCVRTTGDPHRLIEAIRHRVTEIDSTVSIREARTMEDTLNRNLVQERFVATIGGFFGLVALLLAAIGLYGVMSEAVTRRTREIGIRMALGAKTRDVLKLVVKQGMILSLIGIAIGLLASFALTRLLSSLLFGVTAEDPATFVFAALLLLTVAFLASYIPARRATKVDPMVALRYE
jgi:putative ABC transport system permease protein